jgi:hypothetical protein
VLLQPWLVAEDQVLGLEIAVDDPLRVRVRQPRQKLLGDAQRARRGKRPVDQQIAQGASGDALASLLNRSMKAFWAAIQGCRNFTATARPSSRRSPL